MCHCVKEETLQDSEVNITEILLKLHNSWRFAYYSILQISKNLAPNEERYVSKTLLKNSWIAFNFISLV